MRTCAFLTTDDLAGYVTDDALAEAPLAELGWAVEHVPWRQPGGWERYEAVVIRSTWDYHKHPEEFLAVLEEIGRSGARLANPLELVRWNARKTYLRDLESRGLPVVPTVWDRHPDAGLFDELDADEIVVKPVISASAFHTYRLRRGDRWSGEMEAAFAGREVMAQPFLRSIVEEGEFSLFYFGGKLSHTVLKSPKEEDFRVQEEHDGLIRKVDPPGHLVEVGHRIVESLPVPLLYARVDLARLDSGGYALMELELIEPSLYFRTDPESPRRFARAFDDWMNLPAAQRRS
ncbi:MAG: RimK family alpha-L-glutamate ligase [Thermoanaerobaculia bacterium]